jgi:hypothetical protein
MNREWLWDQFYEKMEDEPPGLDLLRLFAVNYHDLEMINRQYEGTRVEELPPLPFYTCWFESEDHQTHLMNLKSRTSGEVLPVHGIMIAGSNTLGYKVGLFFKRDSIFVNAALSMWITPELKCTWKMDNVDKQDEHIPSFLWALSELSTAGGVHFVEEVPPRPTRRRYQRSGKPCPPRQVLIIGNPSRPSNSTGDVDVDWSCRWWVRGHWRHLKNKKIWIKAYVKGPAGKPWREPPPKYLLAGK